MNRLLAVLLFIAILPMPYSYYLYLRIAVMLGIIYLLVSNWKIDDDKTKAILIVIGILFNPFTPFYIKKWIWIIIDFIAGMYLWTYIKIKTYNKQ
jgi:hypothetical protein